jgi:predicted lipoprotein
MKKEVVILVCSFALLLVGCKKEGGDKKDPSDFNRAAMLENLGEELILNGYAAFENTTALLEIAATTFNSTTSDANLDTLKNAYQAAYISWQGISPFEFGPAGEAALKSNLNIYPTSAQKIEDNITNGKFELDVLQNKDAKGFPALDYLLYHNKLDSFTTSTQAANRKQYLLAIVTAIAHKAKQVHSAWSKSGNNYIATFKQLSGTDVGSSLGSIVNELNKHMEVDFRDGKFGIPVGIRSAGIAIPNNVEAFYSGFSIELAQQNLQTIKKLYLGMDSNGKNAAGLDDHLIGVGAEELNSSITVQLATIEQQLQALQSPLSTLIETNPTPVETLYKELQKLVVLFKVDMPSRLGVLITYQDNDGD